MFEYKSKFLLYKGKTAVLELWIVYSLYDIKVKDVKIIGGELPEIEITPSNVELWLKNRIYSLPDTQEDLKRIRNVLKADDRVYVNQAMLPAVSLIEGFVSDDDYILKPKTTEMLLFCDDNPYIDAVIKIKNDIEGINER